ncbi:MAG: ribose 5-phosphate isomerase B [Bacteroidia bacterium]
MKIAIGCDHAGYHYKEAIKEMLTQKGFIVIDHGTNSPESVDYPDHAHKVATDVETQFADFGILICGSGNGVCITANKHKDVRAALCWTEELGALARLHNNANILCLPARFINLDLAKAITNTFLTTSFEGGRHQNRVNKINCA